VIAVPGNVYTRDNFDLRHPRCASAGRKFVDAVRQATIGWSWGGGKAADFVYAGDVARHALAAEPATAPVVEHLLGGGDSAQEVTETPR
jgi:nucleoside-diphosphate-sugar epimerase